MSVKDHLRFAGILTKVMDDQFRFLGLKFGVDPLLDFLPFAGSFIGLGISFYLIWVAWKMELSDDLIAKMIRNIMIDFFIGEVPVIGIIGDAFYKSNLINLEIIKKYAHKNIIEGEIV